MAAPSDDEDLELRHYVDVLRRRKVSVIVTVLLALLAGAAFTLVQSSVYRSTAEILVQAPLSERIFAPTADLARSDTATGSDVATQVAVLQSETVRSAAEKALGGPVDVEVRRKGDTDVIEITATSDTKAEAAKVTQVYTDTYLAKRREQLAAELTTTIDAVNAEIAVLDGVLGELDKRIQDLNTQIQATFLREVRAPLEAQRDQLTQQRTGPESRRSELQQRLDRLRLASTLTRTGGVELLSAASEPTAPARPVLGRNLAVALALGLVLGAVVAFLRDHFDDTVRSEIGLQRAAGDTAVLGLVPAVRDWRDREATELVMQSAPRSPAAEAYARLRTTLDLVGATRPGKKLQITSAGPGDGKTTTTANLGISLARSGRRVILVDANLRRPRLHRFFGFDNGEGLTSVLSGTTSVTSAIRLVPDIPRLRVLPSGPRSTSPSELLSSRAARDLLTSLAEQSDVVLVDSPPLPVSDAIGLTDQVDAAVLVVCANRTARQDVAAALEALDQAHAPLAGIVLNCVTGKAGHGLTYGREEAAAEEKEMPPRRTTRAEPEVDRPVAVESVDT
ncbi:MAG: polysaccharide biosynthesis tyrosine autokinase [Actinomycetota bacterium]|nr:polysaccharide biosynthesis tyrosine autokinase [Actinomycetota bacterium]